MFDGEASICYSVNIFKMGSQVVMTVLGQVQIIHIIPEMHQILSTWVSRYSKIQVSIFKSWISTSYHIKYQILYSVEC